MKELDSEIRVCPKCGSRNPQQQLVDADFKCAQCGLEMAHVETSVTGAVRKVISWLHVPGEILLDRFRIAQVLGKGGFAATYLVEDLRLSGKKRALKEIPQILYDENEIQFLSGLSHPAIPDIIDRADADGMVYLILEFGGGRTLESERRRRGGRIPASDLLPWLQQLGGVLEYLHGHAPPIVHRDLKPENVLLDEQDRVMLIDFGIAKKAVDGNATRLLARAASHGFSPPEQVLGTGTDPRSDIYSLAATAYALLTGQIPPPAHERVAGKELIAPTELVPNLPPALGRAIEDGLALNINQRPQTVSAVMAAMVEPAQLKEFAETGITARTVRIDQLPMGSSQATSASMHNRSRRVDLSAQDRELARDARSQTGRWLSWVGGIIAVAAIGAVVWTLRGKDPEAMHSAGNTKPPEVTKAAAVPAIDRVPKQIPLPPTEPQAKSIPSEATAKSPKEVSGSMAPVASVDPKTYKSAVDVTPNASRPAEATEKPSPRDLAASASPTTSAMDEFLRARIDSQQDQANVDAVKSSAKPTAPSRSVVKTPPSPTVKSSSPAKSTNGGWDIKYLGSSKK